MSNGSFTPFGGGQRLCPGLDLALVAALFSSHHGRVLGNRTVLFGEVGLVGEVRAVSQAERRVAEAVKTGYDTCILPESNQRSILKAGNLDVSGIKLIGVKHIRELLEYFA